MLTPALEEIANEQGRRINNRQGQRGEIRRWLRALESNPFRHLLYFANGELRDQTIGAVSKRAIVSKLEKLAVPPGDPGRHCGSGRRHGGLSVKRLRFSPVRADSDPCNTIRIPVTPAVGAGFPWRHDPAI